MEFGKLRLKVGDQVQRRDLHAAIGGQQQSGISPSSSSPFVLLFSNPSTGEQHGYFDGWQEDGFFHYPGEGQRGDQVMRRGNKTILEHHADGRSLHLFLGESKGGPVTYAGEFEYVDHYTTDAVDGAGVLRVVIIFRLRSLQAGEFPETLFEVARAELSRAATTSVADVALEEHNTERYFIERSPKEGEAWRREAALVKKFESHMRGRGRRLVRERIAIENELTPLFCDAYDPAANVLVEAKGSVTRESMRMAIGQLFDYRRFIGGAPTLVVLVPSKPREDLMRLAESCGVKVVYATDAGFEGVDRGWTA